MQSRGVQWFVVIMGGLILIFTAVAGFVVHDTTSLKFLPIYGILYGLYLILFITKGRKLSEKESQKKKQSPLMTR